MNGYRYFGCVVRKPEEAKLTRITGDISNEKSAIKSRKLI